MSPGLREDLRHEVAQAVTKIIEDWEELLVAFYNFPAEHWIHLRTTNPIESTFSTVKLRAKVTRGAGRPAAAPAMVPRPDGARSPAPTSSRWSAPGPASNAVSSSNAPKTSQHERAQLTH